MTKKKNSKRRRKTAPPIRLTERDREIILALHKYRFLTTDHLQTLTGTKSRWGMNARLRLLYDHKYVDRPQAQYALFSHADKRPLIYALGNKSASLLSTRYGLKMPAKVYWTEKNRRVREKHIEHTLGIADFMIEMEVLCRETEHLEFISPEEILSRAPKSTQRSKYPFRWKTRIRHQNNRFEEHDFEVAIVPDYVFGIRDMRRKPDQNERFYFVEIDRGTMPITRRDISQTSFMRKILSYADTFERGIATKRFGMKGFQVLTVTTSEGRIREIQKAIEGIKGKAFSANTFLFKSKTRGQTRLPFHSEWQNARGFPVDIAVLRPCTGQELR